jgi:esterase/lipase
MSLTNKQKEALNKLYQHRENIEHSLAEIESILMVYFDQQYPMSYQHWIPQIKTALRNNTKWLSRGDYSMDHMFKDIEDKIVDNFGREGVSKFIK